MNYRFFPIQLHNSKEFVKVTMVTLLKKEQITEYSMTTLLEACPKLMRDACIRIYLRGKLIIEEKR